MWVQEPSPPALGGLASALTDDSIHDATGNHDHLANRLAFQVFRHVRHGQGQLDMKPLRRRTGIPAACWYCPAFSRRTCSTRSIRRRDHPSRPSASICSRFSSSKTLAIFAVALHSSSRVNVSAASVVADFQVIPEAWSGDRSQACDAALPALRNFLLRAPSSVELAMGIPVMGRCLPRLETAIPASGMTDRARDG
jgi:hypothetical protein